MIKRVFDFIVALLGLVFLSPVLLVLTLLIRKRLGRPALFRQSRAGKNGKTFVIYKFRTMTDATDEAGNLLPDGMRLNDFGRMLRATSLDELPELWNVLKGDMSLVGPRPLLPEYLPLYTPEQARRHTVAPGITGWSQVNGRNSLSWRDRLCLDTWYVDNRSFALDVKILWRTIRKVLHREGISLAGEATMTRFTGSDE
jgi:lipopolysaccharide/colanic/teichoic acid biosynthesis glycosyltransferase